MKLNIPQKLMAITTAAYLALAPAGCASIRDFLIIDDVSGPDCYIDASKTEVCPEDEAKRAEKDAHALIGKKVLEGNGAHGQTVIVEHQPQDVTINSQSRTVWESKCTTSYGERNCNGREDYQGQTKIRHSTLDPNGSAGGTHYHGAVPAPQPTPQVQKQSEGSTKVGSHLHAHRDLDDLKDELQIGLTKCVMDYELSIDACAQKGSSINGIIHKDTYDICKEQAERAFDLCKEIEQGRESYLEMIR